MGFDFGYVTLRCFCSRELHCRCSVQTYHLSSQGSIPYTSWAVLKENCRWGLAPPCVFSSTGMRYVHWYPLSLSQVSKIWRRGKYFGACAYWRVYCLNTCSYWRYCSLLFCSCATSDPASTEMGDRLRASKPSRYVTSHPGQLIKILPSMRR